MYSKTSNSSYKFHIYLPRCETYALRFAGSEVTGVYGPLEYDEVLVNALPTFPYDIQLDDIPWVRANFSDFALCDAEYEEGMVRI